MSTSCYIIRSQGLGGAPHYSRHFSCMERTSQGDFLGVNERVCSNLPHGLKVSWHSLMGGQVSVDKSERKLRKGGGGVNNTQSYTHMLGV